MSSEYKNLIDFLKRNGASQKDIQKFLTFCTVYKNTKKKEARYEVYRIWARYLRSSPVGPGKYTWPAVITAFLRQVTGGLAVDAPPVSNVLCGVLK